ncbi:alpha-(1,6)-fucosyltransferase-like [Ruditapes philippinarum]|uniref:alpha-(1,6)-fucosyltransferase-like n=1 Tax=Ruditapes philippinarum TaxID=129788 RepID=UPI00295B8957|nr:alpha-(1,6)-fucosyltransferase-like [Ruditapes philippinarum]
MKKVLCKLPISGFGSQAHLLTICFTVGFHTQRTVILLSNTSQYSTDGWESFMLPLSDTCKTIGLNDTVVKVSNLTQIDNISVIDIDLAHKYIDLTDALPRDLFLRIKQFNPNPSLWWAGQIALYVFKPTKSFKHFLDKRQKEFGIENVFVGVHIRRTDKINEANYVNISKYMDVVEQWYTMYEKSHTGVERKVFLATDEPDVVRCVKASYPNYQFINDFNATIAASQKSTRYTIHSLKTIIQDIHFLSMSDFLVCTMSSNVCRLAYELMQTHYGNASRNVKSLDKCYFIYGLTPYFC